VKAAMNSLSIGLQFVLPEDYAKPRYRHVDVFDVLEYIFGFQVLFSNCKLGISCNGLIF
jgi:hypothetical protein